MWPFSLFGKDKNTSSPKRQAGSAHGAGRRPQHKSHQNPQRKPGAQKAQSSNATLSTNAAAAAAAAAGVPAGDLLLRREDVPSFDSIISVAGSPLEVAPNLRKHYVILQVNKDKKDVYVLRSVEVKRSGIDDNYEELIQRINKKGFNKVKTYTAASNILGILNEESLNQQSYEDAQKKASTIQKDFDALLSIAISNEVSDIHFELSRNVARIRFRKHGLIYEHTTMPVSEMRTMAYVIYQVIADVKDTIFDEERPQDAIIEREIADTGSVRVRVSTLPAYPNGFNMTMRVLRHGVNDTRKTLEELGYHKTLLRTIRKAVMRPTGAIIMAGTTGSGKSTSINSMLSEKITKHRGALKVITVEDPPEYVLPGATQVPVNRSKSLAKSEKADMNPFATTIRAAMRNDPDILMVGEVRDPDSALLLVHAVQSGHQALTTIHAGSGIGIIGRLRSNGIPDDVLGSPDFISALIYQRLLPIICGKCATKFDDLVKEVEDEEDEERIQRYTKYIKPSILGNLRFRNVNGCPQCSAGIKGRTVAAETIIPDAFMLKCFRNREELEALFHYRRKGGRFALDHGLVKAFNGEVDIRDVELGLNSIESLSDLNDELRQVEGLAPAKFFRIDESVFENKPFNSADSEYPHDDTPVARTPEQEAVARNVNTMIGLAEQMVRQSESEENLTGVSGDDPSSFAGPLVFDSDLMKEIHGQADIKPGDVIEMANFRELKDD